MVRFLAAIAAIGLFVESGQALERLSFAPDTKRAGWTAVNFPGIAPVRFTVADDGSLQVSADAAASLLWRHIDGAGRTANAARWRWRVDESVMPTDLTRRGADDRALAVYFVFSEDPAPAQNPAMLLASSSVSALAYVFGGDRPRGSVMPSPHMGSRGKFIALRSTGIRMGIWYDETVNVAEDYFRAFGKAMPPVIAVAVSSDSDDTGGRNRAMLQAIELGR